MLNVLNRIKLKDNEAFLDVGVNIGQTLMKFKTVYPKSRYFGFEPNPNCLYYLYQLIKINNFENTTIYPFGLSNVFSVIPLFHFSDSETDASVSIIENFRDSNSVVSSQNIVTVNPANLNFLEGMKIGAVKIDIEGAELEVIDGLYEYIKRDNPVLICEILPVYSVDNHFRIDRQNRLLQLINDLDYEINRIDISGDFKLIDTIEIHNNLEKCNYVFKPRQRVN